MDHSLCVFSCTKKTKSQPLSQNLLQTPSVVQRELSTTRWSRTSQCSMTAVFTRYTPLSTLSHAVTGSKRVTCEPPESKHRGTGTVHTPTRHTTSVPHKSSRNFGRGRNSRGCRVPRPQTGHTGRSDSSPSVLSYLTHSPPFSVNVAFVSASAFCAHMHTRTHAQAACAQLTCSITHHVDSIFARTFQKTIPSKTSMPTKSASDRYNSFFFPGVSGERLSFGLAACVLIFNQ